MRNALFSIFHYEMPKKKVLSLHGSANEGLRGDTSLFLGIAGAGRTTLANDLNKRLIGDDEHCWSNEGIFNIEAGCYPNIKNMSKENEVYKSIKFGSIIKNVSFYSDTREPNFSDTSLTKNSIAAYPLNYIKGSKSSAVGNNLKNLSFLTCDVFGVLPPV